MNPTQYWVVSVSFSAELLDRYHTRRNLTIVHGDAHIGIVSCRGRATATACGCFDWDSWCIGAATAALYRCLANDLRAQLPRRFDGLGELSPDRTSDRHPTPGTV